MQFRTILDVYANLYFHLDNANLVECETIKAERPLDYDETTKEIKRKWNEHKYKAYYQDRTTWGLQPETEELIFGHLSESSTEGDLLLRMMGWLIFLDTQLLGLRNSLENSLSTRNIAVNAQPSIITVRGPVLYRCTSPVLRYLKEQKQLKLVDPNYLELRRKVINFSLAKTNYQYYTVSHVFRNVHITYSNGQIPDLTFGFIPGKFNVEQEYSFEIADEPNREEMIPFAFTGVKEKEKYYERVMSMFKCVLKTNPEFIIMPEFFTPLELQHHLSNHLKQRYEENFSTAYKINNPLMMITGSFHATQSDIFKPKTVSNPDRLYNYAQVTDEKGTKFLDVFKMNPFIFEKNEASEGDLKKFQRYDGLERNAYDRREIKLFDTPFGRIAFLICVDFINVKIEEILVDRHVDLIFVMSLTPRPTTGKFNRRMQEIGERNGAMVVLCNNLGSDVVGPGELESRIVVYLPGFRKLFVKPDEWGVYKLKNMVHDVKHLRISRRDWAKTSCRISKQSI